MRIAVITGASAGIGREFVYAVDRRMQLDEIWVIARREERLLELREKCRNPIRPISLDLSDTENVRQIQALLCSSMRRAAVSSDLLKKRTWIGSS